MLQGAASQITGQQNPYGNNPLNALSNGAAQALNQLSPAAIAQYLNGIQLQQEQQQQPNVQQPNAQFPNSALNAASNAIPNGGSTGLTVSSEIVPVPVRRLNEETPKIQS